MWSQITELWHEGAVKAEFYIYLHSEMSCHGEVTSSEKNDFCPHLCLKHENNVTAAYCIE